MSNDARHPPALPHTIHLPAMRPNHYTSCKRSTHPSIFDPASALPQFIQQSTERYTHNTPTAIIPRCIPLILLNMPTHRVANATRSTKGVLHQSSNPSNSRLTMHLRRKPRVQPTPSVPLLNPTPKRLSSKDDCCICFFISIPCRLTPTRSVSPRTIHPKA